jgi:hypothetical protein
MSQGPEQGTPDRGPWAGRSEARTKVPPDVRAAVDRLTTLMVLATLGIVAASFVGPVDDWLRGKPEVDAAHRGIAETLRARGVAIGDPEPLGVRRFRALSGDDDSNDHDHGDKLVPDEFVEKYEKEREREARGERPKVEELQGRGVVVTRRAVELRDRADDDAPTTRLVEKGARLQMVRLVGSWALLMTQAPDGMAFGWAKTEDLILR